MSMSEGGVYFLSRSELLTWLNDLLQLNYTKVEQCCTGAAHCQIMDSIYPGTVAMSKVKFDAKNPYEWTNNFKELQKVMSKKSIDKPVDVNRLIKGKYQDNLEFLQWIKGHFDRSYTGQEYDPVARRAGKGGKKRGARPASSARKPAAEQPGGPAASAAAAERVPLSKRTNDTSGGKAAGPRRTGGAKSSATSSAALKASQGKVAELTEDVAELNQSVEGLEKERDFYFGKLRDIEILCQSADPDVPKEDFIATITKILYAVEEDFVSPDELEQEGEEGLEGDGGVEGGLEGDEVAAEADNVEMY